ncbi:mitogen-activated protein kinase kinase kinase 20-like [Sarcoramphus papa]
MVCAQQGLAETLVEEEEEDVKTPQSDASGEMSVYASLFKEHHITGKRLLLLEEEDLKDMGIVSRGHIIHLKTAIEKLTHDYLNLFHFPPLIKDSAGGAEENIEKVVNLELVFGYHLKPGNGPKDCKWKMYMEMDGDEIAITYIKDVTFNTNLPDVEILKMTKPPFVMEKWIVGIEEHQSVECVVTYESDVRAPKTTRHIQAICWSKVKAQDEVETVKLMIQTSLPNSEGNSRSRSDSSKCDLEHVLKDTSSLQISSADGSYPGFGGDEPYQSVVVYLHRLALPQ